MSQGSSESWLCHYAVTVNYSCVLHPTRVQLANWDVTRGVRVDHFNYPTRTHSRLCYPYPTRAKNFYPYPTRGYTRTRSLPIYDYRTISVKPMARGGTAQVTNPNVIWLHFDCECRQGDIRRLLGGKLTSSNVEKNRIKSTLKWLGHRLSAVVSSDRPT